MGQRQVCTFRHAQRAAYRTAISAAQTCFYIHHNNGEVYAIVNRLCIIRSFVFKITQKIVDGFGWNFEKVD